jgi:hypothetical protein
LAILSAPFGKTATPVHGEFLWVANSNACSNGDISVGTPVPDDPSKVNLEVFLRASKMIACNQQKQRLIGPKSR